jgi:hypothetical protein
VVGLETLPVDRPPVAVLLGRGRGLGLDPADAPAIDVEAGVRRTDARPRHVTRREVICLPAEFEVKVALVTRSLLDPYSHLGRARETTGDELLTVSGYATLASSNMILKAA